MKIIIFFGVIQLLVAERVRYDGCNSWFVYPKDKTESQDLEGLFHQNDNTDRKILFWNHNIGPKATVEVIVCPEGDAEFREFLSKTGIDAEVAAENIQRQYDEIFARSNARHEASTFAYDEEDYNTYEDIMQQLEVLREECSAEVVCGTRSIGNSNEGRSLQMFTISRPGEERPAIWIDSLIHSGEWLTGPTVMGMLTKLVREYGSNEDVTRLVDTYDFFFVPVMNPDGYIYTWSEDGNRTWRKSRSANANSTCVGKDMNRNYDYLWGNNVGSSPEPCSNNYRGESVASEIETQHVQREGEELADRLILWVTFHVSGWVYLFPYGHMENDECYADPEDPVLQRVGDATVRAITETWNDREWRAGTACDVFYATSGTTQDWVRGRNIAKYVYTPELRGPGAVLPPSEIAFSVAENWNGFVAMVREMELVESGQ